MTEPSRVFGLKLYPIGEQVIPETNPGTLRRLALFITANGKSCGVCRQRELRFNVCKLFRVQLFVDRGRAMRCAACKRAEKELLEPQDRETTA